MKGLDFSKINWSKMTLTDRRKLQGMMAECRSLAAEFPARLVQAKKAGNLKQFNALLGQAEALTFFEQVLREADVWMKSALLDKELALTKNLLASARKMEKSGSYSQRVAAKSAQYELKGQLQTIDREMMQTAMAFLQNSFRELAAQR